MEHRNRVKNLFSYLLNIKNLNEKVVRNVLDYEKIYWERDLCKIIGCTVNKNNSRPWWLEVNKKNKTLYENFFKLYLELEKKGENIEIIWGHGLIAWNYGCEKIVHPIVATRMKLNYDIDKEVFNLVPDGKTSLETSIFDGIDIPNIENLFNISKNESPVNIDNIDPRDINNIKGYLEGIISNISSEGKLDLESVSIDKINILKYPIIYDIPIILIRKVGRKLWQSEISNIINEVDKGCMIPNTIKALVDNTKIEQSEDDKNEWKDVGNRLLFPLEANSEQKEIVQRLCENYGVVVQGPPGTGKSHTIVNLICHLLAHGKRVLVTSQTDRALKVLSNKIPQQIRPLCMSVLGNDTNSLKVLDDSVRKIIDNLAENPENLHNDIKILELQLESCDRTQKSLYVKLKEIQDIENNTINYNGYSYKVIDMAKWIKENKDKYSWIEDKIDITQNMPLTEKEFEKLIHLLESTNKKDKEIFDKLKFVMDKLPEEDELCSSLLIYKELSKKHKTYMNLLENWRIPDNNRCDYDKLLRTLKQIKNRMQELRTGTFKSIFDNYYNSKIAQESLKNVAYKCNEYILVLNKLRNELRNHNIVIPNGIDFNKFSSDFDTLYEGLSLRGRIGKLFKIVHPQCNYIINECKVDGRLLENADQALILKLYIQEKLILKNLENLWENTLKEYEGEIKDSYGSKKTELITIEQYVNNLNTIVSWDKECKREILGMMGKITVTEQIDWHKEDTYDYLIECVNSIKKLDEYDRLKAYVEILKKIILTTGKLQKLYDAIEEFNSIVIKEELKKIEEIELDRDKFLEIERLMRRLKVICPVTVNKITTQWEFNLETFNHWSNAWKWAQWSNFLEHTCSSDSELIEKAIEEEKRKEKIIIEDLVAKKAWYNQILRITEDEKRSLFSWMQAIKRIGKGTGKMVSEYRKIAQSEMEKCKEAIPVWIMPLNRIIENIKISNDLFDVIIFDESSQSDIFSICALMKAKKAIIVGDDKQISPENVGTDQSLIHGLINKHLVNIPQSEWFDLQTSLYDTALRVFPNRLMLKEHFRCIPEIIGFSNKYCYYGDIKPLRYAKNFETFNPPIATVKVEDGLRELNKPINIKEAECIVNKIVECCKDKKYLGMTMGVISLLGEAQGELIENMLRDRIGEEEMIKRRLICGDSYSFQGDERDIMFLSMVISNNVKFTALTREADIRRFNVAVTRARNQLWLFHSINIEDLNRECVRYWLLNYCLNYSKYMKKDEKIDCVFQSKFQKDVYNMLKNKDYAVMPNIKIGTYKIDFVIEGARGRAALICEGGTVHEGYDWEKSLERQLSLERVGWTFYRIRASEFYYDPEKTLYNLCSKLEKMGIFQLRKENLLEEGLKVV